MINRQPSPSVITKVGELPVPLQEPFAGLLKAGASFPDALYIPSSNWGDEISPEKILDRKSVV